MRAGDESAFRDLIQAWSPGMLEVARAWDDTKVGRTMIVREALSRVVWGIDDVHEPASFRTWAFAHVGAVGRARRERESPQGTPAEQAALDHDNADADAHGYTSSPVGGLEPLERAVLCLRDRYGFSAEETCEVLGVALREAEDLLLSARSVVAHALAMQRTVAPTDLP